MSSRSWGSLVAGLESLIELLTSEMDVLNFNCSLKRTLGRSNDQIKSSQESDYNPNSSSY